MRAATRLNSWVWYFNPPSRKEAPSMKSVFVTMAPAMDAFTSVYSPACNAARAMTSSVRLPSVALSRPPTASPVFAATDSVAWLSSAANGTTAKTLNTKSGVCASGDIFAATNTTGTNGKSQSSGFRRISWKSVRITSGGGLALSVESEDAGEDDEEHAGG